MKRARLSKELEEQLQDLLENHPPDEISQDLRNIYFDHLFHSTSAGISIYFRRRLLAVQELCDWLDLAAQVQKQQNSKQ